MSREETNIFQINNNNKNKLSREFDDRWIPPGEHPEKSGQGEIRDHRDGRQDWSCRAQPTSGTCMYVELD